MTLIIWSEDISPNTTINLFDKVEIVSGTSDSTSFYRWSVEEYDLGHFIFTYQIDDPQEYENKDLKFNCYSNSYKVDQPVAQITVDQIEASLEYIMSLRLEYPSIQDITIPHWYKYYNVNIMPSTYNREGTASEPQYQLPSLTDHLHYKYATEPQYNYRNEYVADNFPGISIDKPYVSDAGFITTSSVNLLTSSEPSSTVPRSQIDALEYIDFE